jgi:hypothetical protein
MPPFWDAGPGRPEQSRRVVFGGAQRSHRRAVAARRGMRGVRVVVAGWVTTSTRVTATVSHDQGQAGQVCRLCPWALVTRQG